MSLEYLRSSILGRQWMKVASKVVKKNRKTNMKDPESATKLVLRHLPPTLSEATLGDRIDAHSVGRYNWLCFRPPKTSSLSHRHQLYSWAYIQLKTPQDVFEFADMFNGHIFVNEKGSQFKAVVEYSSYQCVPDTSKKDTRAGNYYQDAFSCCFDFH